MKKEFDSLLHGNLVSQEYRKLSIFIDDTEPIKLIRICGRLMNQKEIPYETRRPILMPNLFQKNAEGKFLINFIILLMERVHVENLHAGPKLCTMILKKVYWCINANKSMCNIIHRCRTCFMQRNFQPNLQLMGHIPEVKQNSSTAFLTTTADLCGPWVLRENRLRKSRVFKTWICVFVCKFTKAIWIELVMNADTNSFMMALRRFLSRVGIIEVLELDQGSNFIGASNALEREFKKIIKNCEPEIVTSLSKYRIKFKFHASFSPHLTACAEAAVGRIKKLLRRVITDTSDYDVESFTTVLCEIQSVLNSAPLCRDSADKTSFSFLSASHLFILKPTGMLAEYPIQENNPVKLYNKMRALVDKFYEHFLAEKFTEVQVRNKWERQTPNFMENDLVLLRNHYSDSKRLWPRAIVIEAHKDVDNVVRFVSLRTSSGSIVKKHIKDILRIPGPFETCLNADPNVSVAQMPALVQLNKKGDSESISDQSMCKGDKTTLLADTVDLLSDSDQNTDLIPVNSVDQQPLSNKHLKINAAEDKSCEINKNKVQKTPGASTKVSQSGLLRRSERIKQRKDKKCISKK